MKPLDLMRGVLVMLWALALILTLRHFDRFEPDHGLAVLVVLGLMGPLAFFETRRRGRGGSDEEDGGSD